MSVGNKSTRVYKGGYVVMPNATVNNADLSYRARGLLAYMLGRPPGWSFSADRLAKETPEGRDAIRTALRELARAGYYRTQRVRVGAGRVITLTEVADSPSLMPAALDPLVDHDLTGSGLPAVGSPAVGQPAAGTPALLVTPVNHNRESGGEVK